MINLSCSLHVKCCLEFIIWWNVSLLVTWFAPLQCSLCSQHRFPETGWAGRLSTHHWSLVSSMSFGISCSSTGHSMHPYVSPWTTSPGCKFGFHLMKNIHDLKGLLVVWPHKGASSASQYLWNLPTTDKCFWWQLFFVLFLACENADGKGKEPSRKLMEDKEPSRKKTTNKQSGKCSYTYTCH